MKHAKDKKYNKNDMAAYKSILLATNIHKQNYFAGALVNSNKGAKCKKIISRLFRNKTGHGYAYIDYSPTVAIDYVHWASLSKLVDQ